MCVNIIIISFRNILLMHLHIKRQAINFKLDIIQIFIGVWNLNSMERNEMT